MDKKRLEYWQTQANQIVIIRLGMDPPEFKIGELLADRATAVELSRALLEKHYALRAKCEKIRHRLFHLSNLHDNMDHWLKMDEMNVELNAMDDTDALLIRADAFLNPPAKLPPIGNVIEAMQEMNDLIQKGGKL